LGKLRGDRSVRVASPNYAGTSSPAPPQGIWFGSHCFTEPEVLPCSAPVCNSGIYAILVRDPTCYPRMMRAIYFGESASISARLTPWHEKYAAWCSVAGGAINLYVAFLPMESSTDEERAAILSALIAQYQPECNTLPELL
jgi:hypothetical protein